VTKGRPFWSTNELSLSEGAVRAACVISDSCKDLIEGLLVADPAKRLTIADIYQHPWFLVDLPQGATQMNDRFVKGEPIGPGFQSSEQIDMTLMEATREL
jgi:serine/threonine-protein kinase SRK2